MRYDPTFLNRATTLFEPSPHVKVVLDVRERRIVRQTLQRFQDELLGGSHGVDSLDGIIDATRGRR
jgi:hypothetical protein